MEFPPATTPGRRPPKAAARFERINHADLTDLTYEAIRGRILGASSRPASRSQSTGWRRNWA